MIFGGSPTRVAVPPMFEANICAIKNGFTSTLSWAVMLKVTGTVKRTVVTLSSRAEQTAVRVASASSSFIGCAFTF